MPAIATTRVTFAELCRLEPRLRHLEDHARRVAAAEKRKRVRCCGNRAWYTEVKPQLVWLVGFQRAARHEVLSTTTAYDVAYHHLYELMPDCRECMCTCL